ATIKGRSLETGEEAGVEKSNDTEELLNVFTSLDAVNILTSGVQVVSVPPAAEVATVSVPTGSGLVPTASPIFTTASVVTPYSRCKGKEKMRKGLRLEQDNAKKMKTSEDVSEEDLKEMMQLVPVEEVYVEALQLWTLVKETNISLAKKISKLKKRFKKLEKRKKSRPARLRRLKKERIHDADMFGVDDLEGNEVIVDVREKIVEKEVSTADLVTTVEEVVTAVEDSVAPTTVTTTNVDDELTLAKTLIVIKVAKPKVISTAITTPRAKTMFEPHVKDIIWKYQQGAVKVNNWKLFDSCGVYCVTTKTMVYYLLVEKMYPFTNNVVHQLWSDVRLQVDYEVEMAYDLLRLIRRQINEGYKPE
nr:hypothetical protein [Tanacetum cinerariifolium]